MTLRLKLICHASTADTREAAFPIDAPLDDRARKRLASMRVITPTRATCLTSPTLRARETASCLGLETEIEPALRDLDYGRWAGRSLDEIQASERDALGLWLADPEAAPHGGETVLELIERVSAWMEQLENRDGTVVAVTHASVIRAAIVHAISGHPFTFWRVDIAPLVLASLTHYGRRWVLSELRPLEPDSETNT